MRTPETGQSTVKHASFKREIATNIVKGAIVIGAGVGALGAIGAVEAETFNPNHVPATLPEQIIIDIGFGEITVGFGFAAGYVLYVLGRGYSEMISEELKLRKSRRIK